MARRFDARLTALFAKAEPSRANALSRRPSRHLAAAADHSRAVFDTLAAQSGVTAQWWQLTHGSPSHVVSETVFCSRYADLVIMGQAGEENATPPELAETVVLQSGRPALVIPRAGTFPSIGDTVAVAWNASREASRAVHDALPFLRTARAVKLLTIHGKADYALVPDDSPPVDLAGHLRRWGVPAADEHLVREDVGKMDLLLSQACDMGADLLVMGAHGHHGNFSLFHSSATQFMLDHMTLPILLSH
ncbi:MAG: universal stress protein [Magnetospirillum sp.]|nr:universal stress protein [Magnetospirillum sp.]